MLKVIKAVPPLLAVLLFASFTAQGSPQTKVLKLEVVGTYSQPEVATVFDQGAAEIVAFDSARERLFVANGNDKVVDILDISNTSRPKRVGSIDVGGEVHGFLAGGANSVATSGGVVAVAIEARKATDPGAVGFYDTDGKLLKLVPVGAMPDMLTFTPDGNTVLVANEGESEGGVNPEGSVSVIDVSKGVQSAVVRTASFSAFDGQARSLHDAGVRLFPNVLTGEITLSQDVEPEYIAIDPGGKTALVTLQEANSVAVLDIEQARITRILPLGTKNHGLSGNGLDVSDKDEVVRIETQPVFGLYMPDAIASYRVGKSTYYITANEGDYRSNDDEEGVRVKALEDSESFDLTGAVMSDELRDELDALPKSQLKALGRLNISPIDGLDSDGRIRQLHSYGTRSFAIWNERGELLWDSGDALEKITALAYPENFNASHSDNKVDMRSDKRGPEPETVTVARLFERHYAFIGLERVGGVVVYDVEDPNLPVFVDYVNNRDFSFGADDYEKGLFGGDLGPEGLLVIDRDNSPAKTPLLVVANEVSGTVTLWKIEQVKAEIDD